MNILYINGHPYEKSFHKAIEKHYLDGIDKTKHKVKVLHLGQMEFDDLIDKIRVKNTQFISVK